MATYFVNTEAQENGDHEVHQHGCKRMPALEHLIFLGNHADCHSAVAAAKDSYKQSNGCYYCCPECHTS